MFTIELYAAQLAGRSAFRVEAFASFGRKPRPPFEKLARRGPQIARAMITDGQASASDEAAYQVGVEGIWPEQINLLVTATNGGVIGDDLILYKFQRRTRP